MKTFSSIVLFFIKGIIAAVILIIVLIVGITVFHNLSFEMEKNKVRDACKKNYSLAIKDNYSIFNDNRLDFKLKESSPLTVVYRDYNNGKIFGRQDANECFLTNEKPIIFEVYYKGVLLDSAKFYINISYKDANEKNEIDFTKVFLGSLGTNLYEQRSEELKKNSDVYNNHNINIQVGDSGLTIITDGGYIPIEKNKDKYGENSKAFILYSLGDKTSTDYKRTYISDGKSGFNIIHNSYTSTIVSNKTYRFDSLANNLKNSLETDRGYDTFIQEGKNLSIYKDISNINNYDESILQNICLLKAEKCKDGYIQIDLSLNSDNNKYYLSQEYMDLLKLAPFERKD